MGEKFADGGEVFVERGEMMRMCIGMELLYIGFGRQRP
jgi:hypothetical protein